MGALTQKQSRFVDEYLVDLNGTQAAIRAGYSEKSAAVIADENLRKPYIKQAIEAKQQERQKRTEITQDTVLADIEAIKRDAMKIVSTDKGASMLDHKAALKAAELQLRHFGALNDKLTISDHKIQIAFE